MVDAPYTDVTPLIGDDGCADDVKVCLDSSDMGYVDDTDVNALNCHNDEDPNLKETVINDYDDNQNRFSVYQYDNEYIDIEKVDKLSNKEIKCDNNEANNYNQLKENTDDFHRDNNFNSENVLLEADMADLEQLNVASFSFFYVFTTIQ